MKKQSDQPGFTLVEIMIVVIIIGLLATIALPGFRMIRAASQDKGVLNNARQLAAAADQYFMQNGVDFVASSNLVGSDNYVKALATVAAETYPPDYTAGITITVTGVGNARTITYSP